MIKKCEMCGVDFRVTHGGRVKYCMACRYDAMIEYNRRHYWKHRDKILARHRERYQKKKLEAAK